MTYSFLVSNKYSICDPHPTHTHTHTYIYELIKLYVDTLTTTLCLKEFLLDIKLSNEQIFNTSMWKGQYIIIHNENS